MSARVRAAVFDALKASAERYGGIGAILMNEHRPESPYRIPCCLLGHLDALEAERYGFEGDAALQHYIGQTMPGGCITDGNDAAVKAINARKGVSEFDRVSWDEFVAELKWERGP